ncbi:DNA-binding Lrp family transcriptional regulator [Archangium gephyra]|uniref:DNA-binding Lrp family transcriptional regulator n=1 Tax=Archangium gephyra TaxID=48 RepID=A0AAC8QCR3_9BACT|nr:Lrp/AsnC family transcriptional regulator [Archangium gephyra]AKJ05223.1 Transcriptional regulator, AsnC family [Archangium gephyra]REG35916.1 DNA-binding Lrp family transcriptional regulator [Archangium gephyra]
MEGTSKLDPIDFAILEALQKNARLSNKELAAEVGLAQSSCLARVTRLREAGVLKSFHAEVDPRAVGIGLQAMIAVRLRQHSREMVEEFRHHALSLPQVLAVYHVAGANDFLVHVAVRDADHLRDLGMDAFTTRPEVAHLETSLIFEYVRSPGLPLYGPKGAEQRAAPSAGPVKRSRKRSRAAAR